MPLRRRELESCRPKRPAPQQRPGLPQNRRRSRSNNQRANLPPTTGCESTVAGGRELCPCCESNLPGDHANPLESHRTPNSSRKLPTDRPPVPIHTTGHRLRFRWRAGEILFPAVRRCLYPRRWAARIRRTRDLWPLAAETAKEPTSRQGGFEAKARSRVLLQRQVSDKPRFPSDRDRGFFSLFDGRSSSVVVGKQLAVVQVQRAMTDPKQQLTTNHRRRP